MFKNLKLNSPLYVSIDIDALDPAFAPGVSHLEPGGLATRDIINIISKLDVDIIGADIVEYNPKMDTKNMTAITAAKVRNTRASARLSRREDRALCAAAAAAGIVAARLGVDALMLYAPALPLAKYTRVRFTGSHGMPECAGVCLARSQFNAAATERHHHHLAIPVGKRLRGAKGRATGARECPAPAHGREPAQER